MLHFRQTIQDHNLHTVTEYLLSTGNEGNRNMLNVDTISRICLTDSITLLSRTPLSTTSTSHSFRQLTNR